MRGRLPETEP